MHYILREKEVMRKLNEIKSPFFVELYYTFQDSVRLCACLGGNSNRLRQTL